MCDEKLEEMGVVMSFSTSEMKDLINKMVIYADTLSEEEQANFIFSTLSDVTKNVYAEFETQLRVHKIKLLPFAERMNQYIHKTIWPSTPEVKFTKKEIHSLIKHNYNAIVFLEDEEITTGMLKEAFASRKLGCSGILRSQLSRLSKKFPLEDKQFQKDLTFWVKSKKSETFYKVYDLFVEVDHPPRWVQELYLSIGSTRLKEIDEDIQRRFLIRWKDPESAAYGFIDHNCKNYIPIFKWMVLHNVSKISHISKEHLEQMCKDRVFKSTEEVHEICSLLFPKMSPSEIMIFFIQ